MLRTVQLIDDDCFLGQMTMMGSTAEEALRALLLASFVLGGIGAFRLFRNFSVQTKVLPYIEGSVIIG